MSMGMVQFEGINERYWRQYTMQMAEEIQEGDTDLTINAGQNFTLPYPIEADDPDLALLVKGLEIYLNDAGIAGAVLTAATGDFQIFRASFFYFKTDQVDETLEAYEDEQKMEIARITLQNWMQNIDDTNGNASKGVFQFEGRYVFKSPRVFPLNVAMRTIYSDNGTIELFEQPQFWNLKTYFDVARNPMSAIDRLITQLRSNLSR